MISELTQIKYDVRNLQFKFKNVWYYAEITVYNSFINIRTLRYLKGYNKVDEKETVYKQIYTLLKIEVLKNE